MRHQTGRLIVFDLQHGYHQETEQRSTAPLVRTAGPTIGNLHKAPYLLLPNCFSPYHFVRKAVELVAHPNGRLFTGNQFFNQHLSTSKI